MNKYTMTENTRKMYDWILNHVKNGGVGEKINKEKDRDR